MLSGHSPSARTRGLGFRHSPCLCHCNCHPLRPIGRVPLIIPQGPTIVRIKHVGRLQSRMLDFLDFRHTPCLRSCRCPRPWLFVERMLKLSLVLGYAEIRGRAGLRMSVAKELVPVFRPVGRGTGLLWASGCSKIGSNMMRQTQTLLLLGHMVVVLSLVC